MRGTKPHAHSKKLLVSHMSCKDLKVLLKLSHSISNHLCESFERELWEQSYPQNHSLLLPLNPKSSFCWKDTHSLINDILIEASAWEKNLSHLPVHSDYMKQIFISTSLCTTLRLLPLKKKSAVTLGMSLKQTLSRKVKLLRKNTIQMSGKSILVLAHYTCSSILRIQNPWSLLGSTSLFPFPPRCIAFAFLRSKGPPASVICFLSLHSPTGSFLLPLKHPKTFLELKKRKRKKNTTCH